MQEHLKEPKPVYPRSPEYLDMGGAESLIPAVREIGEVLKTGETFIVVGGGGSGKTESMATAFEQERKSHKFVDLRGWTIGLLSDKSTREACLIDPNIGTEAREYVDRLHAKLSTHSAEGAQGPTSESAAATVKEDYWADTSYGVKHAEGYLLDREIEKMLNGESEATDGLLSGVDSDVVVIDEFDLSIGDTMAPVEVENATKLIKLVKASSDTQLGLVIHPAAVKDKNFSEAVRDALDEPKEPHVVMMQYFPAEVEKAVLDMLQIDDERAQQFMDEMHGLPSAYLDVSTKPELRSRLMTLSQEQRAAALEEHVNNKLTRNKKIIFDRMTPATQAYLLRLANNEPVENDPVAVQEALVNLYVTLKDGEVFMPPVIKKALIA